MSVPFLPGLNRRDFMLTALASGIDPRKGQDGAVLPVGPLKLMAQVEAPANVQMVSTSGYNEVGDGGHGRYLRASGRPRFPGSWFRSADRYLPGGKVDAQAGGYWVYTPDERGVNARAFGAVADGVSDSTRSFRGVDNAPMIQAAIDFAVYSARCKAYLPAGVYRLADGLQLGYGVGFESCWLEGDGPKFRAESSFTGSALLADFSDRPALAVSGARGARIHSLAIMGANFHWMETQHHMGPAPLVDDTAVDAWISPGLNKHANGRHTPYAAVAIDPYAGPQPAEHYPDVKYPAWLGETPQYDKAFSSFVSLEDCYIGGFVAGIAIQPCDADSNGDFIKLSRVQGEMLAYVITAGNTQGRSLSTVDCSFAHFHTGIANGVHGHRQGQIELNSSGTDWEDCIQILDIQDATNAGGCVFNSCYSENIWRIGNWGGAAGDNCTLTLQGCSLHFNAQNDRRGRPRDILRAGDPSGVSLLGTNFSNYQGVAFLDGDPLSYALENCSNNGGVKTTAYQQHAHTFLAGGVMFRPSPSSLPGQFSLKTTFAYNFEGTSGPVTQLKSFSRSKRSTPVCAWLPQARASNQLAYVRDVPPLWTSANKRDGFSSVTLEGSALSITFKSRGEDAFMKWGPLPGDVVYDDQSGSVFYVRAREGQTVTAELQNNRRVVGGEFDAHGASTGGGRVVPITPFSPEKGNFYFGNSRVFLPEYFLRGDITARSPVITNCGRDDGYAAWMSADQEIVAGDYIYVEDLIDRFMSPADARVVAVDAGNKTITLSGGAARTALSHPLGFFIRQPPPNS